MKAVFGVVSLLLVLAVVGVFASRTMKSAGTAALATVSAPETPTRQQAAQVQEQLRQDLNKASEEAARRLDAADK